jgi:hypothetical protein
MGKKRRDAKIKRTSKKTNGSILIRPNLMIGGAMPQSMAFRSKRM